MLTCKQPASMVLSRSSTEFGQLVWLANKPDAYQSCCNLFKMNELIDEPLGC